MLELDGAVALVQRGEELVTARVAAGDRTGALRAMEQLRAALPQRTPTAASVPVVLEDSGKLLALREAPHKLALATRGSGMT